MSDTRTRHLSSDELDEAVHRCNATTECGPDCPADPHPPVRCVLWRGHPVDMPHSDGDHVGWLD
jgi:hypothetical protein